MDKIPLETICAWAGGRLNADPSFTVKKTVIDSRAAGKGSLFVCIKGSRSDGHDFAGQARKKGAVTIGEREECDIRVSSSVAALGNIAREYRKTLRAGIVAVTGSNGKTTTVRMIASVLGTGMKISASPRSFNNNIGLPLAILDMNGSTEAGILEMGANHAGEIKELCGIARPDIGVITNIGKAHLGYFGSVENIIKAKFELAESLRDEGALIYNSDQRRIREAAAAYGMKKIGFGLEEEADVRGTVKKADSGGTVFECGGKEYRINVAGSFNVYNALAAVAAAGVFGLKEGNVRKGLKRTRSAEHRMKLVRIRKIDILDDCYNANPTSVKTLFKDLLKIYPQKNIIAVMGEMRELGEYSEELHRETGEFISRQENVRYFLAGGSMAGQLVRGAGNGAIPVDNIYKYGSPREAAGIIRRIAGKNSLVVLKASRGDRLESLIDALKD
ncbi:MAG: UDP-N-acetylmuramoyl-tripeptide--D-alanyl-D-alanine ligase [Elusimicrobia bacterium]|nr:UDP-N-acetylmuramoyl-tripeptide--D-alanyl-D-alanine ligase [Elusimicrobiota bacterium]